MRDPYPAGRRSAYWFTAAAALLALTGCGSSGSGGDAPPAGGPTSTSATGAPVRDKGPECAGTDSEGSVHVLRGGGFVLPGGGGVQYAAATADGRTRTATLRDGASYQDGQAARTVAPGGRIAVSGHTYRVAQVCSYRVVLVPQDAAARTALAAAPASMKAVGGRADAGLCFSTGAAVRAAASDGFPPKGSAWTLSNNGGRRLLPTGWSAALYSVDATAGTAVIRANCAAIPVAAYKQAAVGDTLEFAGATFKVTSLTPTAAVLTRTA
ncbi:hypothetical protein [Streptomyces sp. NBC_01190]|uniref:hypothetical protein n=1 Tax=Streptomyces sp. NBC_01190 TaxID=2903767 RepID=UPI0038651B9F|nr:hypothetical protein OG519_18690 [Streptomyces sp. NBC_01190]